MSESNHNASFDEGDNTTQGGVSPSTSRASSPASTPNQYYNHLPFSPIFGANNNMSHNSLGGVQQIKEEPHESNAENDNGQNYPTPLMPDFRFSQNFLSHFFDRRKLFNQNNINHQGEEEQMKHIEKPVPTFSQAASLDMIRDRLEAAMVARTMSSQVTESNALFKSEKEEELENSPSVKTVESSEENVHENKSEEEAFVENNEVDCSQ